MNMKKSTLSKIWYKNGFYFLKLAWKKTWLILKYYIAYNLDSIYLFEKDQNIRIK